MSHHLSIRVQPTEKQRVAWKFLMDHVTRDILFGGGAGGGKTWLGCEWLLLMCITYPGTRWFIGRAELKRILQTTYITFEQVLSFHNVPKNLWKYNGSHNYIRFWNGSRIDLLDLDYSPSDQMYQRLGSFEFTGGFIEEASEVRQRAVDMLKSRVGRCKNKEYNLMAKIYYTCNPEKNWVYREFYRPWRMGILAADKQFIQSLYRDNPHTSSEYENSLNSMKDPLMRQRLRDGNWDYEEAEGTLMSYDSILAMFGRELPAKFMGEYYVTHDVARFGRDTAVIFLWHGRLLWKVWLYNKQDTKFLKEKIAHVEAQYHVQRNYICIDQDGVGGGVVDHLPGCFGFVNGASPVEEFYQENIGIQETKRVSYLNLRSQCYFALSEWVNKGEIAISNDIPEEVKKTIIEDLQAVRRKDVHNNEKKMAIINKDEMKETLGRSPDYGDSMMMRCVFSLGIPENFEVGLT